MRISDLSIDDAARLMGLSRSTVARWVVSGAFPGTKLGGRWHISRQGVAQWLRARWMQECLLSLRCLECGEFTAYAPAPNGQDVGCGPDCRNSFSAADHAALELVLLLAGAGNVGAAESRLNEWLGDDATVGRWELDALVFGPTRGEHREAARGMQLGTDPDFDGARRADFAAAALLWGKEDSVFDGWEPREDVSV